MSFTDEQIARIAHGAAVELAIALGQPALAPWSSYPADKRAADATVVKVARFGAPPAAIYMAYRQLDPEMPEFDTLSPEEQAEYYLFSGVCVAMNAAADVRTRHENELLALREAEQLVQNGGGNQPLRPGAAPFGGLPPVLVQAPQPPTRATEE
jgi:hypothetical protein